MSESFFATLPMTIARSFESMLSRTAELARGASEENQASHICIVCRTASTAAKLHADLVKRLEGVEVPVRLGHNRHFEFAPGITVSNSRQVKGLEFDVVSIFDPNAREYPAENDGRRALCMVVTRAKERLHFVSSGETTPLLEDALASGLIELVQRPTVPPVQFTEEDDEPF